MESQAWASCLCAHVTATTVNGQECHLEQGSSKGCRLGIATGHSGQCQTPAASCRSCVVTARWASVLWQLTASQRTSSARLCWAPGAFPCLHASSLCLCIPASMLCRQAIHRLLQQCTGMPSPSVNGTFHLCHCADSEIGNITSHVERRLHRRACMGQCMCS